MALGFVERLKDVEKSSLPVLLIFFPIDTKGIYRVFLDLPFILYFFMFFFVIWFCPQFCQWVLASSNKTYPMVFVVIRLSWKGVSSVYFLSSVAIAERSNPQSGDLWPKASFSWWYWSTHIAFMSYYEDSVWFLFLLKAPVPQGLKRKDTRK